MVKLRSAADEVMESSAGAPASCAVCGASGGHRPHRALERIFYSGRTFSYRECDSCGSLWLTDPPDDLDRYYPSGYYSFTAGEQPHESAIRSAAQRLFVRGVLSRAATARAVFVLTNRLRIPIEPWVRLLGGVPLGSAILDVGSGSGRRLQTLRRVGFTNLTGIDAFLPEDAGKVASERGVTLRRGTVEEVTGSFDLVMFHHSLEHMNDPSGVLRAARRLLTPGGAVIVRVPLAQTFAWRCYGMSWVQVDAPRHQFLFSEKGFRLLAQQVGLAVRAVVYDSNAFQFWGSELHLRGVPVRQHDGAAGAPVDQFSPREVARFEERARQLNRRKDGDQAAFLLTAVEAG
jgi:SAM-dependent methyltransferase